jgi:hypothetical protein
MQELTKEEVSAVQQVLAKVSARVDELSQDQRKSTS